MPDPSDASTELSLFDHLRRQAGGFDATLYRSLLGAANEFKDGDAVQGLAAEDAPSREQARRLLAHTRIGELCAHPVFEDELFEYIESAVDPELLASLADWTLADLKRFLLEEDEDEIRRIGPGLPSDVIGCVVKLCSNAELVQVGQKLFHPLPGSKIGSKGYLGARLQPNSPTDHPDDIRWQVFDGFAYAVGDVLLGTNPVSSDVESVAAIERALMEIVATFGLEAVLPHCVLAHIDVVAEVERRHPGTTGLWFQSLGGVEDANRTFDIDVAKMVRHAGSRTGPFALYFETGQGADATNGHGHGFDMVLHEARKYGFARALRKEVGRALRRAGRPGASEEPWLIVNDVAGFIGPEIFRTREQLVRCCLEDTVMGKLHGHAIGLDVCSTLHMEIDLDDLDWCLERILPANPAYLMALPTKIDPMLGYLTTGFQDHVRLRERFGYRVEDRLWRFFQELGVLDAAGRPTEHFGQPTWVYLQYRRRQGDERSDSQILAEGRERLAEVRNRGVFIAEGHGAKPHDLEPALDRRIRNLYEDSKRCLMARLPADFANRVAPSIAVATSCEDRRDYILHPPSGERFGPAARARLLQLRESHAGRFDVQVVLSDGLNPLAISDPDHVGPYLEELRRLLAEAGYRVAPEHVLIEHGRVRAGYRLGEILFAELPEPTSKRAVLHLIGERPGTGHHAFSVYIAAPPASTWALPGRTDHNLARVVSGIAETALRPSRAARDTLAILQELAPLQGGGEREPDS